VLGFPIRKSSDLSSVDSSPRLIAASYVLHRLLVPRHPPYALKHLLTKMLASTVQFSNNTPGKVPYPDLLDPHGPAVSRKTLSDRLFCLERHSRVLSGPNSVSVYPSRTITEDHPYAMKVVSVPPMSTAGLHMSPKRLWHPRSSTTRTEKCRCSLERR
jgi:hypothetical protein